MEEEYKEKLEQGLIRLSELERDYLQSWASGSRTEYEERIKQHMFSKMWTKTIAAIGILSIIGGAGFFTFINFTVEKIVDGKVETEVKKTFRENADGIIANIDKKYGAENGRLIEAYEDANEDITNKGEWQRNHDIGHLLRKYVDVFIKLGNFEKSKVLKEFIIIFYNDAIDHFHKANKIRGINSSTNWELGKLFYEVALNLDKYGIKPDFEESIKHYTLAIENYSETDIEKGWRASAYYDMSKVYLGRSQRLKIDGDPDDLERKQDIAYSRKYMKIALSEFRTVDRNEISWITKAIVEIEDNIESITIEDSGGNT